MVKIVLGKLGNEVKYWFGFFGLLCFLMLMAGYAGLVTMCFLQKITGPTMLEYLQLVL